MSSLDAKLAIYKATILKMLDFQEGIYMLRDALNISHLSDDRINLLINTLEMVKPNLVGLVVTVKPDEVYIDDKAPFLKMLDCPEGVHILMDGLELLNLLDANRLRGTCLQDIGEDINALQMFKSDAIETVKPVEVKMGLNEDEKFKFDHLRIERKRLADSLAKVDQDIENNLWYQQETLRQRAEIITKHRADLITKHKDALVRSVWHTYCRAKDKYGMLTKKWAWPDITKEQIIDMINHISYIKKEVKSGSHERADQILTYYIMDEHKHEIKIQSIITEDNVHINGYICDMDDFSPSRSVSQILAYLYIYYGWRPYHLTYDFRSK